MTTIELIYLAAAVVLIVAAAITGARFRNANGEPEGFGGWLLIFAATQILETVWLIAGLVFDVSALRPGFTPGMTIPQPSGTAAVWFTILAGITFATTLTTTAVMLRRSRWIQIANIVQSVALTVETFARTQLLPPAFAEYAYLPIAIAVLVSAIWIAYLARSVRARNTFTR